MCRLFDRYINLLWSFLEHAKRNGNVATTGWNQTIGHRTSLNVLLRLCNGLDL